MEKEELSFIIENNGEKREKFVKRHIRNITCQQKSSSWIEFFKIRKLGHFPDKYHGCCTFHLNFWVGDVVFRGDY